MSNPQQRAKQLADKIAEGSTENLSANDITSLQQLLQSLSLNSPGNQSIREPRVNDPTPFSGVKTDGCNNLENFLTQLNMVFRLQGSRFPDELSKVFYAASYMKDIAFKWIQPYIAAVGTAAEDPITTNYDIFCESLRKMFGDVTMVSDAENKVMRMKQGNRTAADYTTEFKRYAVLTEFNEPALFWAYRNNISAALQDELIVRDTPSTLQEYQDVVINLDLFMRERKNNRDTRNNNNNNSKKHPNKPFHAQQQFSNHHRKSSDNDDVRPMEIDNTTRKDQKKIPKRKPLSESEKRYRRENGLCLYCGDPDHEINECTVKPPTTKKTLNATSINTTKNAPQKGNTKILCSFQDFLTAQSNSPSKANNLHEHIIVDIIFQVGNKTIKTYGMIDSGSMANFIDVSFSEKNKLPVCSKDKTIEILTVDGSPINSGPVKEEVKLVMSIGEHEEAISLDKTKLGQYPVILGMPWLKKHDPIIKWSNHTITFDSNHCLHHCFCKIQTVKTLPIHPNYDTNSSSCNQTNPNYNNKDTTIDTYSEPVHSTHKFPNIDIQFVSYASIKEDMSEQNYCYINASEVIRIAEYPVTESVASTSSSSNTNLTATKEDYSNVPEKYSDLYEVFSKKKANTLPPHRPYDHQIILQEGKSPPFGPIYNLSQAELDELAKYLKENLANGFISRSTSPAAAPILFVKKKSGELRLCIDNRGLNAVTVRDPPVLPLVSEMIDRLGNALYYTKLDVRNAYYRIRIKAGQEWLTGFRCKYGHFQYNVLNFGLVNAPSTWMAYLNDVLREHIDQTAVFFYDDILVFTNGDLDQHTKDVKAVLKKLLDAELYIKAEKCEFDKTEVSFLGIRIGRNGVSMDTEKIQAITEWPTPKSQQDVMVFLGFANYHRSFLKHFSLHTTVLTNLLKKDRKFNWGEKEENAFNALKKLFTSNPVLKFFNPDKPCVMETDASDFAIGSILSQYDDQGVLHPIAYYSRKLKPAEINYEIYDKEMLAIVDSFLHWRHYLEDAKYQTLVLTDHKNLEYFATTKKLNRRQARYAYKLSPFHFIIQYRSATQNKRADALSRRPDFVPKEGDKQPVHTLLKPEQLILSSTSVNIEHGIQKEILYEQRKDPIYQVLSSPTDHNKNTIDRFSNYNIDTSTGLLLKNSLIYIPANVDLRLKVVKLHHDTLTGGHFGRAKTAEMISRNYWWKNMNNFIKRYVANCQTCIRGKASRQAPHGPLKPLQIPGSPWSSISMDFIVKLPKSNGFDSIWVVVDRLTKMAHFVPCNETINAKQLAQLFIQNIFRLHGLPSSIVSDRGVQFTSKFWKHLLAKLEIQCNMSTSHRPQTDGQTERTNATLEQYLRMFSNYQQDNWSSLLPYAEFSYNNHQQTSTKASPFFANYGINPKVNLSFPAPSSALPQHESVPAADEFAQRMKSIHDENKSNIQIAQRTQALYYDKSKRSIPALNIGDEVYLNSKNIQTERPSKKLDHKRIGPFKIISKVGSHAFKLDLPSSMKIHPVFNVALLTPKTINGLQDFENRQVQPTPPVVVSGFEEYEVEEILDSRVRRNKLQYKIRWKNYPDPSEDTWEDQSNVVNAPIPVQRFHDKYPNKPSPTSLRSRKASTTPSYNKRRR